VTTNLRRIRTFRKAVLAWGRRHLREFPWRETRDPYRILLAEIMLRRTRPAQVLPVYRQFLKAFPSSRSLAAADESHLRGILAPLGLRWRAENVIALSQALKGAEPSLLATSLVRHLPGVGDYVASAVQVMAFDRPRVMIDANVIRVLGRYWGYRVHAEARREGRFCDLAKACLPSRQARLYTLALLDIGATICLPRRPRCMSCPLQLNCVFALKYPRDRALGVTANIGKARQTPSLKTTASHSQGPQTRQRAVTSVRDAGVTAS
jgi:A/G-specific adenine glycosylase